MTDSIQLAEHLLLAPHNLNQSTLQTVLGNVLGGQIDYADLYFQSLYHEVWSLEDSKVKEGHFNIESGVGVRALSGEKTGFAYSDDVQLSALEHAADAAKSIAKSGQQQSLKAMHTKSVKPLYAAVNPIESLEKAQKVMLLQKIDRIARDEDPRVKQVSASLSGVYDVVLMAKTDGEMAADIRPLVRISVSVIVEQDGRREQGFAGGGGRYDYNELLQADTAEQYAKEAVRIALTNLSAKPAPAGAMPVVLGAGWPGVLLHEAVGHGLEGDFNRKGVSAFSDRIGEQVAAKGVTVVDDGSIAKRRGSLSVDDEGTPTQRTVLIEDGILKGYMQDNLNAKLMGTQSTGNCRRESYAHVPMPRMTNTFMLEGEYDPQEIIKSVDKGLFAVNFAGGQVDITSGKFVFSTSEAYLIENGKITHPVKGATLIGNGPEAMNKISMIGNNLELDTGIGVCGKEGQSVPVGVGQPTLRVDELIVGGTQ